MPRYIDADALQEAFDNPPIECTLDYWYEECLENAPTADVEPVIHGRWIDTTVRGNSSICCSECGSENNTICLSNYCHNCGAKMDGGERDEEQQAETDNNSETS